MDDLEITRRCAERDGRTVRPFTAESAVCYDVSKCAVVASNSRGGDDIYDPLHNDAQAMALVRRLGLSISTGTPDADSWFVFKYGTSIEAEHATDLNRAICECVARLP